MAAAVEGGIVRGQKPNINQLQIWSDIIWTHSEQAAKSEVTNKISKRKAKYEQSNSLQI